MPLHPKLPLRASAALLLLAAAGCRPNAAGPAPALPLAPAHADPVPAPRPPIDFKSIRPNELGAVPILMYHAVGGPAVGRGPRYDRRGLNIAPETFRKHLRLMHEAGWYPVNMRDALAASLDIPAGKIPVVITFDDGRGSQLRYLKEGRIDPDCAVGIMEQFHAEHPDWPTRATFYVMPRSRWNPVPFYQQGAEAKKLRYLVAQGYEVANHSTSHRSMARMDAKTLQWEVAESIRGIHKLSPEATMDTFALPYGAAPRSRKLLECLMKGADSGTAYENRCVLIAWGGPAYPAAHKKHDAALLTRIGSEPGNIEAWIKRLKPGKPLQPYVSDGDPLTLSVPRSLAKFLKKERAGAAEIVIWDDTPAKHARK